MSMQSTLKLREGDTLRFLCSRDLCCEGDPRLQIVCLFHWQCWRNRPLGPLWPCRFLAARGSSMARDVAYYQTDYSTKERSLMLVLGVPRT